MDPHLPRGTTTDSKPFPTVPVSIKTIPDHPAEWTECNFHSRGIPAGPADPAGFPQKCPSLVGLGDKPPFPEYTL